MPTPCMTEPTSPPFLARASMPEMAFPTLPDARSRAMIESVIVAFLSLKAIRCPASCTTARGSTRRRSRPRWGGARDAQASMAARSWIAPRGGPCTRRTGRRRSRRHRDRVARWLRRPGRRPALRGADHLVLSGQHQITDQVHHLELIRIGDVAAPRGREHGGPQDVSEGEEQIERPGVLLPPLPFDDPGLFRDVGRDPHLHRAPVIEHDLRHLLSSSHTGRDPAGCGPGGVSFGYRAVYAVAMLLIVIHDHDRSEEHTSELQSQ